MYAEIMVVCSHLINVSREFLIAAAADYFIEQKLCHCAWVCLVASPYLQLKTAVRYCPQRETIFQLRAHVLGHEHPRLGAVGVCVPVAGMRLTVVILLKFPAEPGVVGDIPSHRCFALVVGIFEPFDEHAASEREPRSE